MDAPPPAIPTRMSTEPEPVSATRADDFSAYHLAIAAAARCGTPVDRGVSQQVLAVTASILCFPGDLLHVQKETVERAFEGLCDVISTNWNKGGVWAFLAFLLAFVAWPLLGALKLESMLATVLALPFDLLRYGLTALARAIVDEEAVPRDRANFFRIAPQNWPRLAENAAADAAVARYVAHTGEFAGKTYASDVLIIPGYATARFEGALHPRAAERAQLAARDFFAGRAPFILVSGCNVHPANTPFNEAAELKRYLVDVLHVPADRVILEPTARHSPTNVRNAGRYMVQNGLARAEIVSDDDLFGQTMIFNAPHAPFFGVDSRSIWENGVSFGSYRRIDRAHTAYVPNADVMLVRYDAKVDLLLDDD